MLRWSSRGGKLRPSSVSPRRTRKLTIATQQEHHIRPSLAAHPHCRGASAELVHIEFITSAWELKAKRAKAAGHTEAGSSCGAKAKNNTQSTSSTRSNGTIAIEATVSHPIHLHQEGAEDTIKRLLRGRMVASSSSHAFHLRYHTTLRDKHPRFDLDGALHGRQNTSDE